MWLHAAMPCPSSSHILITPRVNVTLSSDLAKSLFKVMRPQNYYKKIVRRQKIFMSSFYKSSAEKEAFSNGSVAVCI